ncbi:hypothetical protein BH11BAC1_BH11BAC1_20450 [soil metagenome]
MKSLRLEALGDGIFSIAMTIMVLELKFPEVEMDSWHNFILAVASVKYNFLCYIISFIVLGIMWFGHRVMFEYIGRSNRYFIFLGVLFYMFICLVPFSTRLLAEHPLKWFAILIYAVNLSVCNLTLYLQWSYGLKHKSLMEREISQEVKEIATFLFLISPVVYAVAVVFSFFIPIVSIFIFAITPLIYILPNKIDKFLP